MTDPGPKGWVWHGELKEQYPEARPRSVLVQFKPPERFDVHYCGRRHVVMRPVRAGLGWSCNCRGRECAHIAAVVRALEQRQLQEELNRRRRTPLRRKGGM